MRLLKFDFIVETAELAEMYARHVANHASIGDEEAIAFMLKRLVERRLHHRRPFGLRIVAV